MQIKITEHIDVYNRLGNVKILGSVINWITTHIVRYIELY